MRVDELFLIRAADECLESGSDRHKLARDVSYGDLSSAGQVTVTGSIRQKSTSTATTAPCRLADLLKWLLLWPNDETLSSFSPQLVA